LAEIGDHCIKVASPAQDVEVALAFPSAPKVEDASDKAILGELLRKQGIATISGVGRLGGDAMTKTKPRMHSLLSGVINLPHNLEVIYPERDSLTLT
jgi:hypothetical protein